MLLIRLTLRFLGAGRVTDLSWCLTRTRWLRLGLVELVVLLAVLDAL